MDNNNNNNDDDDDIFDFKGIVDIFYSSINFNIDNNTL